MTPSKVIHVSAHYPPYLGGLEKVVQSLASYRDRLGLPVEVLTSQPAGQAADAAFVQRLGSFHIAHTTVMPSLVPRLLRLKGDSVVHLHVSQAYTSEAVYLARLVNKVPYVAHMHIDVGPSGTAGFLLHAYKPFILGPVLRGAEVVVVFTEEQRRVIGSNIDWTRGASKSSPMVWRRRSSRRTKECDRRDRGFCSWEGWPSRRTWTCCSMPSTAYRSSSRPSWWVTASSRVS